MIKQLIAVAMPLLIHNALEAIQCTWTIFNFTMLAQYVSNDNKTLQYMEHVLYRLEKTRIAFEHYWPINPKLCRLAFNYPKFHVISHFAQCIQNFSSVVNYDTTPSKTAYKYLLKTFYNKTNKKEYDSQIRQHNVHYTNIMTIKDVIAMAKRDGENKKLLAMENVDKTAMAEVAKVLSAIDLGNKHS